jgi:lipid-A-disaccharide synthase-like uncharacterized protein
MFDPARQVRSILNRIPRKSLILFLTGIVVVTGFLTGCKDPGPAQLTAKATQNAFDKQCDQWNGFLSLQKMDGEVTTCSVTYELKRVGAAYEGALTISRAVSDIRSEQVAIPLLFRQDETGRWLGRMGDSNTFQVRTPCNANGAPDKWRLSMLPGGQGLDLMLFGDAHMDLALSGRLPLPDDLGKDVVWTDARLHRAGFQIKIGRFNIILMECVGLFANLFFAWRFVVQWIASERAKRSVIPELFWWISLAGTIMMLVYAIYFGRLAVFVGQMTGWVVYIRNIWLIKREKQRLHLAEQQAAHAKQVAPESDPDLYE